MGKYLVDHLPGDFFKRGQITVVYPKQGVPDGLGTIILFYVFLLLGNFLFFFFPKKKRE